MAHTNYDPAKEPCDPLYHPLCAGYDMCIAGPGGDKSLVENNEKGILETGLAQVRSRVKHAELGHEHGSYRQGIYGAGNSD
jgi:hypothetical protein